MPRIRFQRSLLDYILHCSYVDNLEWPFTMRNGPYSQSMIVKISFRSNPIPLSHIHRSRTPSDIRRLTSPRRPYSLRRRFIINESAQTSQRVDEPFLQTPEQICDHSFNIALILLHEGRMSETNQTHLQDGILFQKCSSLMK